MNLTVTEFALTIGSIVAVEGLILFLIARYIFYLPKIRGFQNELSEEGTKFQNLKLEANKYYDQVMLRNEQICKLIGTHLARRLSDAKAGVLNYSGRELTKDGVHYLNFVVEGSEQHYKLAQQHLPYLKQVLDELKMVLDLQSNFVIQLFSEVEIGGQENRDK